MKLVKLIQKQTPLRPNSILWWPLSLLAYVLSKGDKQLSLLIRFLRKRVSKFVSHALNSASDWSNFGGNNFKNGKLFREKQKNDTGHCHLVP